MWRLWAIKLEMTTHRLPELLSRAWSCEEGVAEGLALLVSDQHRQRRPL